MVEEADEVAQADQAVVIARRQGFCAKDCWSRVTLPGGRAYGPQPGAIETESGTGAEPTESEVGDVERLQRVPCNDLVSDPSAVAGAGRRVERVKQRPDGNSRRNLGT